MDQHEMDEIRDEVQDFIDQPIIPLEMPRTCGHIEVFNSYENDPIHLLRLVKWQNKFCRVCREENRRKEQEIADQRREKRLADHRQLLQVQVDEKQARIIAQELIRQERQKQKDKKQKKKESNNAVLAKLPIGTRLVIEKDKKGVWHGIMLAKSFGHVATHHEEGPIPLLAKLVRDLKAKGIQ